MTVQNIAIIGAGFTGATAGVYLSEAGHKVTLFEAAHTLGGRARSITYRELSLDNGQHICLGAYSELLRLLLILDLSESSVFLRLPFEWSVLPHFHLSLPKAPSPWRWLIALWQTRGLSITERWHFGRLLYQVRRPSSSIFEEPVALWLAKHHQSSHLIEYFWEPLCLAALNTPIEDACTQIFVKVLRSSLENVSDGLDLLLPRVDLSQLIPNHAANFIKARQGKVQTGKRIKCITPFQEKWEVEGSIFDQVVIATAPQDLAKIDLPASLKPVTENLASWTYPAIATIYLQYPSTTKLPRPMIGLVKCIGQWVFDRGITHGQHGLIAVVISHIDKNTDHIALAETIQTELEIAFSIGVAPLWTKVIIEKKATFGAVQQLNRPSFGTGLPGLWLAGDYMIEGYPATLESAVKSGRIVSQHIMEQNHEKI